jgi:hypothetical protein
MKRMPQKGPGVLENDNEIITEIRELHRQRYGTPSQECIEAGRVRDFLLAMDEPLPALEPGAEVPALFLLTLGRTRRPQPQRGSAVNGGDSFRLLAPAHVGDTVRVVRELLEVERRSGRQGPLYVSRILATYTNQHDEVIATAERSVLQWGL